MKRAVFLDRDGTINQEVGYLDDLSRLELIKGAATAIRMLNQAGLKVIVITNQSGVARGFFGLDFVEQVHSQISMQLRKEGAWIDRWYFCPHHPETGSPPFRKACRCRKPGIGMLERAAAELGLDLGKSYLVGDSAADIKAGWRAGTKSILVLTGHGHKTIKEFPKQAVNRIDLVAPDLKAASRWIVEDLDK